MSQDPCGKGGLHTLSIAALSCMQFEFRDDTCSLKAGTVGTSATKEEKGKTAVLGQTQLQRGSQEPDGAQESAQSTRYFCWELPSTTNPSLFPQLSLAFQSPVLFYRIYQNDCWIEEFPGGKKKQSNSLGRNTKHVPAGASGFYGICVQLMTGPTESSLVNLGVHILASVPAFQECRKWCLLRADGS